MEDLVANYKQARYGVGKSIKFFVTVGQRSDYTKTLDLIEGGKMGAISR